ncbi:MAG: EF-P lysine aminoacylase GenX [Chromatiales bacterium]|nr:EF-P lysine aminoacylase GenX [Chromatiales bacterium]
MSPAEQDWQPAASHDALRLRARILGRIRAFFAARDVLEVETPVLSQAANADPAIASLAVQGMGWLHTSPEFPMKRLLAAGSGAIYQIARVFRGGEQGRYHNPEFTLLEWYRPGFDHHALMDEVAGLVAELIPASPANPPRIPYRDAFLDFAGFDPFQASLGQLRRVAGDIVGEVVGLGEDRDAWLDLLFSTVVQPRLPAVCFVVDFPATQAALARLSARDPRVAERFELFIGGVELANGYHELSDAVEQARRMELEHRRRQTSGLPLNPIDVRLLAALRSGLPDCAGVALGLDRLIMLAGEYTHIDQVLAFPWSRA